jgi:hypothetical protein
MHIPFLQQKARLRERGFTLLLAALVASIALSLGAAIFGLAQKEVTLSSLSKSSQFAFYAADTAAECALYWDVRSGFFASTTPPSISPTCDGTSFFGPPTVFVNTGGAVIPPLTNQPYVNDGIAGNPEPNYKVTFEFQPNGYCADVTVYKSFDGTTLKTLIHADGYSTPCATKLTSQQALQRSVELNY